MMKDIFFGNEVYFNYFFLKGYYGWAKLEKLAPTGVVIPFFVGCFDLAYEA